MTTVTVFAKSAATGPGWIFYASFAEPGRWSRSPSMSVATESSGALTFRVGPANLTPLTCPDLAQVVLILDDGEGIEQSLLACGVPRHEWFRYVRALHQLYEMGARTPRRPSAR